VPPCAPCEILPQSIHRRKLKPSTLNFHRANRGVDDVHSADGDSVPRGIIQNLPANLRRNTGVHVIGGTDFGDGELDEGNVKKISDDQEFRALAFYLEDRVPGRVTVSGNRFYTGKYVRRRCESARFKSR